MLFLVHVDNEPAELRIDGKTISIPPNDIFEVPEIRGNDFNNNGPQEYIIPAKLVMDKILQHAWYHGIVQVPVIKKGTSITVDAEGALVLAKEKLEAAHTQMLQGYVTTQQERVLSGSAALPPGGRVAKIIEAKGINLKKEFNIDPPGWKLERMNDRDNEMENMRQQIAEMRKMLEERAEPEMAGVGKKK